MGKVARYVYENWYRNLPVQYEMAKQLFNREFAALKPSYLDDVPQNYSIRNLRCHSPQHFQFLVKALNIFKDDKIYNFYFSLAKYKDGVPYQTMNLLERDNTEWNSESHKHINSYDFLIDIDADSTKDIKNAYFDAKKVKKFLDNYSIPYQLRFSGKGFHFIMNNDIFSDKSYDFNDDKNIYKFYQSIAKKLKKKFSERIDLKIYDSRRLCKLCYTLANYDDETFVCHPFHGDADFGIFKLDNFRPLEYIRKYNILQRGFYTFNNFGDSKNMDAMLKNLKIKEVKKDG